MEGLGVNQGLGNVMWASRAAPDQTLSERLSSNSLNISTISTFLHMDPMKIMNTSQITHKYSLMNFPPKNIEIQLLDLGRSSCDRDSRDRGCMQSVVSDYPDIDSTA